MKLFVQARKDGYNVLYPKPTPTEFFQFAGDIRPNSKEPNLLGKCIYTIAFTSGGCIFTKHVIIQDVQRQGLGNIGFSIFIPNIKKLSGNNVIKLLDELLNTYCKNYCPDYYLENKTEDWAIYETMANQYDSQMHNLSVDNIENYQKGTGEAAYIYYSDELELQKYFDSPYQEEFRPYKQVFLVEKNLEGKSDNPLNAIPHDSNANLTGKIDLENPKYKLLYNQQARGVVKIEVKVNGRLRYNKSKIKRKEDIQIIWSKQFYKTEVKYGKWDEIGPDFLIIDNDDKTITVKEIELTPITYTISVQTKDRFSNPIYNAEITLKVKNYLPERKAINNSFKITEEELKSKCYIIAKKDNLISPQHKIKFEDIKGSITLVLSEHKEVKFYVKDENELVNDYNIQIYNKEIQPKDGSVVFIGDEIEKTWRILVSHRDYDTVRINYCPARDEPTKYVYLKKRTFSSNGQSPNRKKYYIKIDEQKGKRSYKDSPITKYVNERPQYNCDTKYGYKFERWHLHKNETNKNHDGYYEAIFKKLWYRKIPKLVWVFFIIVIIASTFFLLVNSDGTKNTTNIVNSEISNKVNTYIDGIELNLDTLKEYKSKYCDNTTIIQSDVKEKSLWKKIWIFGSNDDSNTTNESSVTPDFCSKIYSAIVLRRAINNGNIDELIDPKFSEHQQNLKNAIDSIEDKYKKQIGDTLLKDTVSHMNFNVIAELILKTQKDLREKENEPKKNMNKDKLNNQKIKGQQKSNNQNQHNSQTKKQHSRGNSLEKKFWDLVRKPVLNKEDFDKLFKKTGWNNDYKIFYNNYLSKSKSIPNKYGFDKFVKVSVIDRTNAETLTELESLIKKQ